MVMAKLAVLSFLLSAAAPKAGLAAAKMQPQTHSCTLCDTARASQSSSWVSLLASRYTTSLVALSTANVCASTDALHKWGKEKESDPP